MPIKVRPLDKNRPVRQYRAVCLYYLISIYRVIISVFVSVIVRNFQIYSRPTVIVSSVVAFFVSIIHSIISAACA